MVNEAGDDYSAPASKVEDDSMPLGSDSGFVAARSSCDHLASLSSDLSDIPRVDTRCKMCNSLKENWLCLSCKEVFCSRFVNRHMLEHNEATNHTHVLALSYSDLSVWCFACDAYLDAELIEQLKPVHEAAYNLKFGELPPPRTIGEAECSSSA